MKKIELAELKIADSTFLEKVEEDLRMGIRMKDGGVGDGDVIRVWTDASDWQFSVLGISNDGEENLNLVSVEISSIGLSKIYMQMEIKQMNEPYVAFFTKLSKKFAQEDGTLPSEAREFLDAYIRSKINRELTKEQFEMITKETKDLNLIKY